MENEIVRIEIPEYIRKVLMSKKRMKKYYVKDKKDLPKKYSDKTKYDYKEFKSSTGKGTKFILIDLLTKEKVIANPKVFGTEKWKVINGQKIYNGEVGKWERNTLMQTIKESYVEILKNIKPFNIKLFPITIKVEVHDMITDPICKGQLWDVGNRVFPYFKGFEDALKKHNIIPDDNIMFITQSPAPIFIPVDRTEDRKLIFIIASETDPRIINHKQYKEFYGRK